MPSLTPTDIITQISLKLFELKDIITIKGELHNYSKRNQNIFASIKDNQSSIDIICWNSLEDFENGDEVEISGKINFYKKTSKINLIVSSIKKLGVGDQFKLYEQLKQEFQDLGYFDKKKVMPKQIESIGIVTSEDGAALQDVLYVLRNGGFDGEIIIKDCLVQGVNAPKSIKDAIESFKVNGEKKHVNRETNSVDILLITRGGGSLEDLMAFSSKEVVKAIYDSAIFTISAVGHEVDSMLSDFVADLRAPTPSVGAQIILNEYNKKFGIYKDAEQIMSKIQFELKSRLDLIKKRFPTKDEMIKNIIETKLKQILDEIKTRFKTIKFNVEKIKNKIESENIIIINPETGNKVEHSDEFYNEFIIIFNGKRLLINPKTIIDLTN
jgi:exodeoxyribonuclease VII large subunit